MVRREISRSVTSGSLDGSGAAPARSLLQPKQRRRPYACGVRTVVGLLAALIGTAGVGASAGAQAQPERAPATPASAPSGADASVVDITIQVLQFDPAVNPAPPIAGEAVAVPQPPSAGDGAPAVTIAGAGERVRFGDRFTTDLHEGTAQLGVSLPDGAAQSTAAGCTVLAAPRLRVRAGEPAGIAIGQQIPYMEQRDDGSLVVQHSEAVEGISVDARVDAADASRVAIGSLQVRFSRVVSRVEIPGVPFDVGRPVVGTVETATAVTLAPDRVAILALPRTAESPYWHYVLISARAVPGE